MKIRTMAIAATALGLGLTAWVAPKAQAQLWDVVHVNMPYTVTLGEKSLPPGDYTIQQLHSTSGSGGVLLFYSNNGMKFETSAMTIKALDNRTPEDTSVILHHIGDDYYYDKIWIQGKQYGYEFPLPSAAREREKELTAQVVTVPADSSGTAVKADSDVTTPDETTAAPPPTQQVIPPDTPAATPDGSTPEPEPSVDQEPAIPQEPPPAVATPQTPPPSPTTSSDSSANREKKSTGDESMPATSAGWLAMLLGGGTLSGAGMLLRRKR